MPDRKPRASSSQVDAALPRMKAMYEQGCSTTEIGQEVDLSRETVRKALIAAGVEVTSRGQGRPRGPKKAQANKQRKPLSDEEVEKLRQLVGFDPSKQPERKRRGWELKTTN